MTSPFNRPAIAALLLAAATFLGPAAGAQALPVSETATIGDAQRQLWRNATVSVPTDPAVEARIRAIPLVPNRDIADPSALTIDEAAFARTFRHGRMPVEGQRIHFVTGGKGPPLLLLHGWPTSWYEWRRVMPLLAAKHTLVVPDLPGIGRSEGTPTSGRKREIAATMLGLMRQLGHERFAVIGHDWGTPTAFAMAYLAPERITRLLLSESTIPGLDVQGFADWDRFNSMWWHHQFHAEEGTPELLVAGRERAYLDSKYRAWVWNYEGAFTPDYLDEFERAYTAPGALTAGFNLYRALKQDTLDNRSFVETSGRLKMPVMVVTARYHVNEALHRQVMPVAENYSGAIVDNCQHFLMIEAPRTFAAIIDEFVSGRSAPARQTDR